MEERPIKRFIVKSLLTLCKWKDRLWYRFDYPFEFPSILTSCKLAHWSDALDQRWETHVWEEAIVSKIDGSGKRMDWLTDTLVMEEDEFLDWLDQISREEDDSA